MGCSVTGRGTKLRVMMFAAAAMAGASGAAVAEDEPKAFACTFDAGTVATYDKGAFRNEVAAQLSFELVEINLDTQSAKLVASAGAEAGAVRVVRAINANHFLEVANEGFLNLSTVYDRDPATGKHPAVHSRHFGLLGQPVYTSYTGTCVAK